MGYLELALIGVGLSMDAFAVSVCKGLSMRKVDKKYMFVLAVFFVVSIDKQIRKRHDVIDSLGKRRHIEAVCRLYRCEWYMERWQRTAYGRPERT